MPWLLDTSPAEATGAATPCLDEDQLRVVGHRRGPREGHLLVLAGPGTGKTTTIVEAIARRLLDGEPADSILALTFGRKAARELRDRVVARVGGGLVPTVATFHAFAYGLIRSTADAEAFCAPPRLMSGAEEDARIRDLLRGAVEDGSINWPEDLEAALPTMGLANEVRAILARARELGLDGDDLTVLGQRAQRPAWVAVGELAQQEQEVMALENVMDYTQLLVEAVARARDPQISAVLHSRFTTIFVDEYQDTDPLQVELLRALAGPAATVIAVGDPDQSIYSFRGADSRGILRFPEQFRSAEGRPAEIVVLGNTRRFGPRIRAAATSALGSRMPAGLGIEHVRRHRHPSVRATDRDEVDIRIYDSAGAQAAHVARQIRLAHVAGHVPWGQMAVLVRSGHHLAAIQRALVTAGVPTVVAADEIPLAQEPAVAALLAVLDLGVNPGRATSHAVADVLTGPVVGLSPTDLRKAGRRLRRFRHVPGFALPPSEDLLRDLVVGADPQLWDALEPDDEATVILHRFQRLLDVLHSQLLDGASPESVLWTAWTGGREPHGWPQRLRASALAGSRSAHHDLDAIMALFDAAARIADRYPGFVGVRMFLDTLADQQIPAETVSDRRTQDDAVRVLTAHRAKGLEWDDVWVVGIQEGAWPDLRARGSTLHVEEVSVTGVGEGLNAAELLDEERRLFYVACTRARKGLHLTAVDERESGGERPSRFLLDLARALETQDPDCLRSIHGRPAHPVSLDGLVAELRRTAADPDTAPALRDAAIERLALLRSEVDDDGEPLVPSADPRTWWGLAQTTTGVRPVRDPAEPVALSGSSLDSLLGCPLQWFLDREARAEVPSASVTKFGSVVHAVADFVGKGQVPPDLDAVDAEVSRVWSALRFDAAWQGESERAQAREALSRFLEYHRRADRSLVDTEVALEAFVEVPLPSGGTDTAHLRGFIDRVERDSQGRIVPIDLKNKRTVASAAEIAENGQLGVYQRMVEANGDVPGGAALVQLRVPAAKGAADPKIQSQDPLPTETPTWIDIALGEAVDIVRREAFDAQVGNACRFCSFHRVCPTKVEGEQVIG